MASNPIFPYQEGAFADAVPHLTGRRGRSGLMAGVAPLAVVIASAGGEHTFAVTVPVTPSGPDKAEPSARLKLFGSPPSEAVNVVATLRGVASDKAVLRTAEIPFVPAAPASIAPSGLVSWGQ